MTAKREPEENVKYRVVVGNSIRRFGGDTEIFKVQYDSKKPTSVNESAGGKVEFNSSKASFEYKSMQGGKVKLSGKVVDGVPKEYILVFEDDMFRLERATKNVASLRTESNRNSTWNQMASAQALPPRAESTPTKADTPPLPSEPAPIAPESPPSAHDLPVQIPNPSGDLMQDTEDNAVQSPVSTPNRDVAAMDDASASDDDDDDDDGGQNEEAMSPEARPDDNSTARKTVFRTQNKDKVPRLVVRGSGTGAKKTVKKISKGEKDGSSSSSSGSGSSSSSSDSNSYTEGSTSSSN